MVFMKSYQLNMNFLFQLLQGRDKNDIQLADTGYGQGQVLMTPLHLALTYAPIVNEGNIPSPHLLKEEKVAGSWKENVVSKRIKRY